MGSSTSRARNLNVIISALAGLVIVSILVFRVTREPVSPEVSAQTVDLAGLQIDVQVRSDFRRVWEDTALRLSETASSAASSEVFQPYLVRAIPDVGFAVFDFGDKKVKIFQNDGTLSASLGGGAGEGPSEFLGATDMYVENSRTVHVLDARQSRLTSFDLQSSKVASNQIRGSIVYRVAAGPGDRLLGFRLHGESMLGWITTEGDVRAVPEIVPVENPRDWITMDGDLHWAVDSFVLSPRYYPILIVLDQDARFVRAVSTMEYHMYTPPTLEYRGQSVSTRNNQALRVSTTIVDRDLLALSAVGDTLETPLATGGRVVDRYRMPTGSYISSFVIPSDCARIAAHGDWFYCTTGDELRIFRGLE